LSTPIPAALVELAGAVDAPTAEVVATGAVDAPVLGAGEADELHAAAARRTVTRTTHRPFPLGTDRITLSSSYAREYARQVDRSDKSSRKRTLLLG
jgi:hypothetical protein